MADMICHKVYELLMCILIIRNRKRVACVYGVIMHAGDVGRIREKRVIHEA
jgi:hypothetical protein